MKKYTLLFIPLLLTLSCKKETTITKEPESEPISKPIELVNPFKNIIKTSYTKSTEAKMNDFKGMSFLGSLSAYDETNNFLNPLIGARIINSEISMNTVDGTLIQKQALQTSTLSAFRETYQEFSKADQVLTPRISYALYSPDSLSTHAKTNITLVLKSTYFTLDLNTVKDENIDLSNNFQLAQAKSTGAYLAKIGYGMSYITEINSDINPKVLIPALEAYLNDCIYNKGLKAAELKKEISLDPSSSYTYLGGSINDWFTVVGDTELEKVDFILKNLFVPKVKNAFGMVNFEFRSLKDDKIIK